MAKIVVRVKNFEKYKGRGDVANNSWFRCSNRLLEDPDFFDFTAQELLVWIYILSVSSQKNVAELHINARHLHTITRIEEKAALIAIRKLSKIKVLDIVTLRGRNVDVTPTCSTDRQTDITHSPRTRTVRARYAGEILKSLVDVWVKEAPSRPKPKELTPARIKKAKSFLEKKPVPQEALVEWEDACRRVERSDFLSGRNKKWNKCTFDWVLKEDNFVKIIEGNYDNDYSDKTQQVVL